MPRKVKPVPTGYDNVTPYLHARGAAKAIAFYKKAFGAKELFRMASPGGKIGHAELEIGSSRIMLADEHPEFGALSPAALGGSPVALHLYLENVDKVVQRAVRAGATLTRPVENKFYGDRMGTVTDPFGHIWHVSTHVEDVPMRELRRRAAAMMKPKKGG
jgi:PhnB protein